MCKYVEKPLIFPLSNPSSKAEITADKAYEYSHGKCVYASGGHPCLPSVLCMHTFPAGI
jgi:malic enzyme